MHKHYKRGENLEETIKILNNVCKRNDFTELCEEVFEIFFKKYDQEYKRIVTIKLLMRSK